MSERKEEMRSCAFICRGPAFIVLAATVSVMLSFSSYGQGSLKWEIRNLTVDSNEGIDVADIDNDGRIDVVAGRNWYAAPDFVPRPVRTIEDWNGYVLSNGDFAYDVNADGWIDVIAGAFNLPEVYWYENPGAELLKQGKLWPKHLLVKTESSENEGQLLEDLNGDGTPEWVVNSWSKDVPYLAWRFVRRMDDSGRTVPGLEKIVIGTRRNGHGMGLGDLNGDGRKDLLFESGWYEAPKEVFGREWTLHPDWEVHGSVPMLVRDLTGDGRSDVVLGRGHDYGLYWWEQLPPAGDGKLVWKEHLIDDRFSQAHALHWADLDGDGTDELITGKRVWAHNGKDPGGMEPPCLYYYTWNRGNQIFTRHVINEGQVGGGLQIRTADLDGDGRLDIAVAGKSGTFILFNRGR